MTEPVEPTPLSSRPPIPTWVKALAGALIVAVAVGVAVMILAGGSHGPWQHGL